MEMRDGQGAGEGKIIEWDKHHYPMYMYENANGMTILRAQLEKKFTPFSYNEAK